MLIAGKTSQVLSRNVGTKRPPRHERKIEADAIPNPNIVSRSLRRSFVTERSESRSRRSSAAFVSLVECAWLRLDRLCDWSIRTSSCVQGDGNR
jgi:hypothetical protein